MELIDTHCHLTALSESSLERVLDNARAHDVLRMVCIGAADGINSAYAAVELTRRHTNIYATVGIHPHDAGRCANVAEIASLCSHPRVVAIGETGLDYFRDWSPFPEQRKLFEATIELAKTAKKPLVIHCRDAHEDTYQLLKRLHAEEVGGVFHCYAGDAKFAERLRDINFLVSFTGNITFKKASKLQAVAREIPIEQIMLETDCPYLAPEPFRGKICEPYHLRYVALKLAEIKSITLEEVADITTSTACKLFGLN